MRPHTSWCRRAQTFRVDEQSNKMIAIPKKVDVSLETTISSFSVALGREENRLVEVLNEDAWVAVWTRIHWRHRCCKHGGRQIIHTNWHVLLNEVKGKRSQRLYCHFWSKLLLNQHLDPPWTKKAWTKWLDQASSVHKQRSAALRALFESFRSKVAVKFNMLLVMLNCFKKMNTAQMLKMLR